MVDEILQYEVNVKGGRKEREAKHLYLLYQKLDNCLVLCGTAMKLGGIISTLYRRLGAAVTFFSGSPPFQCLSVDIRAPNW